MVTKEQTWSERQQMGYDARYHSSLLHVPHSSTTFPDGCNACFEDLNKEERLLIDYYTDELFVPDGEHNGIDSIVFPYCRLYCDVERLINDPLEKAGLGISYSRWVAVNQDSQRFRSFSTLRSVFRLYSDSHTEASLKLLDMRGSALLIDCHCFSSMPNLLNQKPPSPIDICIGFNEDETCPSKGAIDSIVQHFKSSGYRVGINIPFSNGKTFSVPTEYHTLMIEVNKKLYMNEDTLEKIDSFYRVKHDLQSLYRVLLRC